MFFETYGLIGLFFASFLSATILPFSSEAVLTFFLLNGVDPWACLAIATLGNSLGGSTNYFIGKLGSTRWLQRIRIKEHQIQQKERWFIKYGNWLAFFSWLPIIGDPLMVVLGYFKSPVLKTLTTMTIGKLLRYLFIIWGVQLLKFYF